MVGYVDPGALDTGGSSLVPLGKGLDLSSGPMKAAPGSLASCMNVEIVDGTLQQTEGLWKLGHNEDCRINRTYHDFFVVQGDNATDFTTTGFTGVVPVSWYSADSAVDLFYRGSGLIYQTTSKGVDVYAIIHTDGEDPTLSSYFFEDGGASSLTIDTAGLYFQKLEDHADNDGLLMGSLSLGFNDTSDNSSADTWDEFRPYPFGYGPVSHVFQLKDKVYAVRDFLVGGFTAGANEPEIGDRIQLDKTTGTDPIWLLADYEVRSGSWATGDAEGWLYLIPGTHGVSTIALDSASQSAWNGQSLRNITNLESAAVLGTTLPQTSPATIQQAKGHGVLSVLDTDSKLNTGWKYVDLGWSVSFDNGTIAPVAQESPLFLTDAVPSLWDSGAIAMDTPTEYGAGIYSWTGLANMAADDATYATNTLPFVANTDYLKFAFAADCVPGEAVITGIEVTVECKASVINSLYFKDVKLTNDNADAVDLNGSIRYESDNKATDKGVYIDSTDTVYTFGGQLDLWGFKEITQDDINNQNIALNLRIANNVGASRTISIDYAFVKIYATLRGQKVYFYSSWYGNIGTATVYAYQVMDGDWSSDDAEGWITTHDIDTAVMSWSAVVPGMQIRTATSGGGDLLATVKKLQRNRLPGYAEMEAAGTRCQSWVGSIGAGEEREKAFVTNGVSPAFAVDSSGKFQFIRLPTSPDKDKPRFVSEQREHLLLGLDEHVMVSSVGQPNNFSTMDGATSWSVGDRLTGLIKAPDNTTIILCADSLHRLSGSGASGQDAFQLITHNSTAGSKAYTGVYLGDTIYLNDFGIAAFATSDKFGDFDENRLNYGIEPWLRPRLQGDKAVNSYQANGPLEAVLFREKGQIRYYFRDGWILIVSWPAPGGEESTPQFTWQHYDWDPTYTYDGELIQDHPPNTIPTCFSSAITSWGEERIVMGTEDGYVYVVDGAPAKASSSEYSEFVINPLHGQNYVDDVIKLVEASIMTERDHAGLMYVSLGLDYSDPPKLDGTSSTGTQIMSAVSSGNRYLNRYIVDVSTLSREEMASAVSMRVLCPRLSSYPRPIKFRAMSLKVHPVTSSLARAGRAPNLASTI